MKKSRRKFIRIGAGIAAATALNAGGAAMAQSPGVNKPQSGGGTPEGCVAKIRGGEEVLQIDEERIQALLRKDTATLDRIVAEEYIGTESSGKVSTKAQFLAMFESGETTFDTFDIEENSVKIYGETAVVAGRYSNRIREGATSPLKRARHLRVYIMRSGRWQLVAHQATEIADQKKN